VLVKEVSMLGRSGLVFAVAMAVVSVAPRPARADGPGVMQVRVSFTVQNVNRSRVACPVLPDGHTYVVAGWLVAPANVLAADPARRAVTLYLHGPDGDFLHFQAVPGYDFATEMARLGHASVVIDRLGYGLSPKPNGFATCAGAQADMAGQIVAQLRSGKYATAGGPPPFSFGRVAIGGHGPGVMIAQVEAYSFGGVDGLVNLAWSDEGFSPDATAATTPTFEDCAAGGQPKYAPDGPPGYAFFPVSDDAFARLFFSPNADPALAGAVTTGRERDPCGDLESIPAGIAADHANLGTVTVPVVLIFGALDAVFPPPSEELQRANYTGSRDVTSVLIENTGHALYLERNAGTVRAQLSQWLDGHGF
jgi:pimeloyl-ACP methyl ester carboxylesterase